MSLKQRVDDLRTTIGDRHQVRRKLGDARRTLVTLCDRREQADRIERLRAAGLVGASPTTWQLWLGAAHMMFGYILPSNVEFYAHYEAGHWWQQVLRVLDEPSAMMDPIGLGISEEMLISHLIQVVHASAGYDVALLLMFEDGLVHLRDQLEQMIEGRHPRQDAIELLLERPDYPRRLLEALDRFEADPVTHWRVSTIEAPEGCEARFDWGIETFGTPGRLFDYCLTLPSTPWASLSAWLRGELRVPAPPQPAAA